MKTLGLRDIIGPIMVGPSSSHTAGALAIASMARRLCGSQPARVAFTLYGSFAHTGTGHGTDKALVAGMMGLQADDLAIRDSFSLAHERGLDVSFTFDTKTEPGHPNTVDIDIHDESGATLSVRGVSIGGGAAVITRIDGIDVDITGEHTSVVVRQADERGVLAHIASCLAECGVNIATTRMYRTRRGATAYTVMETDDEVSPTAKELIERHPSVHEARIVPAAQLGELNEEGTAHDTGNAGDDELTFADAEARFTRFDFASGDELLARCAAEGVSIAELFRLREEALAALNGQAAHVDAYLARVIDVMRASATEPLAHPTSSTGGLIGGEARLLSQAAQGAQALLDPLAAVAASYALAVLETNASMGRIVAAPTAGSAGVVPAVLLALGACRGFNDDQLREGLLTAAAATMALTCAQIALAGVENLVGFDDTVAATDAVGRTLPFELRESALGGIAATPAACAWCAGCR